MGMYDSRMSAWQRRKQGLSNDHCGSGVIGEVSSPMATPVVPEEVEKPVEEEVEVEVEVVVEEVTEEVEEKPKRTRRTKPANSLK